MEPKTPMLDLLNPLSAFRSLFKSAELVKRLSTRNVEARYRGSAIGLLWVFITPLLLLAVYTFVFSAVFKTRWDVDVGDSKAAFALIMLCGMMAYNVFAESVGMASGVIVDNPNYVKKVVFPLETLPFSATLSALFYFAVWSVLLVVAVALLTQKIRVTLLAVPLILAPLFLGSCGVAFVVASVGVFFRDVRHVVGICLQMLFFMTPIFYPLAMVPERYRWLLRLNPLTPIVEELRKAFIFGQWPDFTTLAVLLAASLVVFQGGYVWFMKTKKGFADVL